MRGLEAAVRAEYYKALGVKQERPITFKELAEIFMRDYARVNKRSWETDKYRLVAVGSFFNPYPLPDVTPQLVEQFRAGRLERGNAKSTVNRHVALLKRMFSLAIEWGYAKENPARKVRQFSERELAKERILTDAEEAAMLAECNAALRPVVIAALNTGMRRGELLALEWQDVDLRRGLVRVVKSKSGRQRTIPINQTLRGVLTALPSFGKGGPVFGAKNIQAGFENARTRAGLDEVRFHDLRHTFATRLVDRAVDIITIQSLLGHSTVLVTQRYTHARDDRAAQAVTLLDVEKPPICDTGVTRKSEAPVEVLANRGESVN